MRTHRESVIRTAAVAGLFYPAEPTELRSTVDRLLWNGRVNQSAGARRGTLKPAEPNALAANVVAFPGGGNEADAVVPKALISPHAGYIYSGAVAAAAYRLLARARGKVSRVVLLGPSHRFPFSGMAATSARAYETPLGVVPIDQQWLEQARDVPFFGVSDEAHAGEHCLETQLPFLQQVLGDFTLAPIICGDVDAEQVANLLDRLWGGPETVIVVSSDLSHYLDYQACRALDEETRAAIERLDPLALMFRASLRRRACEGSAHRRGAAWDAGQDARSVQFRRYGRAAGSRCRLWRLGLLGTASDVGIQRRHGPASWRSDE